jgi:hypothetical protein
MPWVADLVTGSLPRICLWHYNAVIGCLHSLFPDCRHPWQAWGSWSGWDPSARFSLGDTGAGAALFLLFWMPKTQTDSQMNIYLTNELI